MAWRGVRLARCSYVAVRSVLFARCEGRGARRTRVDGAAGRAPEAGPVGPRIRCATMAGRGAGAAMAWCGARSARRAHVARARSLRDAVVFWSHSRRRQRCGRRGASIRAAPARCGATVGRGASAAMAWHGARSARRSHDARACTVVARCESCSGRTRADASAVLGRARKDGAGSRHAAASLARACAAALVASLRVSRAMRLALGAGSATVGVSAVCWATSRLLGRRARDRGRARPSDGARHGGSAPPRDALLATRGPSERRRRSR